MSLHHLNKHILQVWLWLLGILLTLLLAFLLALQLPAWQRYTAQQLSRSLSARLHTQVRIGSFRTAWGTRFVLKPFYLQDQQQDTLLYAESLGISLDFAALLRNQVRIRKMTLDQARVEVKSTLADSTYNFDFIRAALAAPDPGAGDSLPSFRFNWGDLQLSRVRVHIRDSLRGHDIRAHIGRFQAQRNWSLPQASPPQYRLVTLEHSTIQYRQTKPPRGPADAVPAPEIGFRKLQVKDLHLDYARPAAARHLQVFIGSAQVLADTFNLKKARIDLAGVLVHQASMKYYQGKKPGPDSSVFGRAATRAKIRPAMVQAARGTAPSWVVNIRKMSFRNSGLTLENYKPPLGPQVLDLNHLRIRQLNLELESLTYRGQTGSARLQHLSCRDESGFRVKKLAGSLQARPRQFLLRHARIQTPHSHLGPIRLFQFEWPERDRTRFLLEGTLASSLLSPRDLALLQPYLSGKPSLPQVFRQAIHLRGDVAWSQARLRVKHLTLRGLSGTTLYGSGEVSGLTGRQPVHLDLQVHRLLTTGADMPHLLPPGAIYPGLRLPARLQLSGRFTGGAAALHLQQVQVKASDGAVLETSGSIRKPGSPQKQVHLQVKRYSTSRAALLRLLPEHTVSPNLLLPDKMVFSGTFQGASLHQFRSHVQINSTFGKAVLDLAVAPGERISGTTQLHDFDLGKFLREEKILGRATGRVSFRGQGLTFATTRVQFQAAIRDMIYNQASYRNIQLRGTLDHETYQVQGGLAKVLVQTLGHKLRLLPPKKIKRPQIKKPLFRKKLRLRKEEKGKKSQKTRAMLLPEPFCILVQIRIPHAPIALPAPGRLLPGGASAPLWPDTGGKQKIPLVSLA